MKKKDFIQRLQANETAKSAFIRICRSSKLHHSLQGKEIEEMIDSEISKIRTMKKKSQSSSTLPKIKSSEANLRRIDYSKPVEMKFGNLEYNTSVGFISKEEKVLRDHLRNKVVFHKDILKKVKMKQEKSALVDKIMGVNPKDYKTWQNFFDKDDLDMSNRVNNPTFRNRMSPAMLKKYSRFNLMRDMVAKNFLQNSSLMSSNSNTTFKLEPGNSSSLPKTVNKRKRRKKHMSVELDKKSLREKTIIQIDKMIDFNLNSSYLSQCDKKYRRKGSVPLQALKHKSMYRGCKMSRLIPVDKHLNMLKDQRKRINSKVAKDLRMGNSRLTTPRRKKEFHFNLKNMNELSELRSKEIFELSAPLKSPIRRRESTIKSNLAMIGRDMDEIIKVNNSLETANREINQHNSHYLDNSRLGNSITGGDIVNLCKKGPKNACKILSKKLKFLKKSIKTGPRIRKKGKNSGGRTRDEILNKIQSSNLKKRVIENLFSMKKSHR